MVIANIFLTMLSKQFLLLNVCSFMKFIKYFSNFKMFSVVVYRWFIVAVNVLISSIISVFHSLRYFNFCQSCKIEI